MDPSSFGQGFQRQVIFTLIKLAAKYQNPKAPAKKKEFAPLLTWILFENRKLFCIRRKLKR
jgi:putative ATP-dependent endonuclease of the OLD family